MSHYCGIDLHSNNHFVVVIDADDKRVLEKRLNNDLSLTLEVLSPYRESLQGIAVESTFNWYWLVDGLQERGYDVRLVNTLAVKQYDGLKYSDDRHDAFHLAHLMRLGILPTGYVYPKAQRAVRDLLRRRLFLVRAAMPALVRRSSEERVLSLSLFLAGIACIVLPFTESFIGLALCAFLMGLGLGCGAPLSMVLVYNRTPAGRTGEAMGLRQTVNKGTEASVPLLFGAITTSAGMTPAFWLVALLLSVGGLLMGREAGLRRITAREPPGAV